MVGPTLGWSNIPPNTDDRSSCVISQLFEFVLPRTGGTVAQDVGFLPGRDCSH